MGHGNSYLPTLVFLSLLIGMLSCTTSKKSAVETEKKEIDYYSTNLPSQHISGKLRQIQKSVIKITTSVIYRTYFFEDTLLTEEQLKDKKLRKHATRSLTHDESLAGTAISLAQNSLTTAFITCAHTISFPGRVIAYYKAENLPPETYVNAITVKQNQSNFIHEENSVEPFDILSIDRDNDLALIASKHSSIQNGISSPLEIPKGTPNKLKWGSFIYVLGYPEGYPMITRGIVSDPNRSSGGEFLIDAQFNHGISGGLIIARRSNSSNFEWMGIASSASAEKEIFLIPNPKKSNQYKRYELYSDTAFVEIKSRINYGITQPIPITKINRFIRKNHDLLQQNGFNIAGLLK